MTAPVLPEYGTGSLAELLPSVAACLGVPGSRDVLGLGERLGGAAKVVVLLVDGLGWCALGEHRTRAPFLAERLLGARSITTGFPSTTASSLGTFGTGLPPGMHGLVGYTFALPGEPGVVNALRWDTRADPVETQPLPTVIERVAAAGVPVTHVAERAFLGSGLTRAALRGAQYPGADTPGETVQIVQQALSAPGRALVYAYTGDLDNVGHLRGCRSPGWLAQLTHVDLLVSQLAAVLPPDAALLVTADHGMVDVPEESKVDYDSMRELSDGVHLLAGEPRARHVYTRAGAAPDVAGTWRELLGDRAWVLTREEAVSARWFGEVDERIAPRIGDVVIAARGTNAVVRTRAFPREASLVGHHGSLTADEVLVPMLTVSAGSA